MTPRFDGNALLAEYDHFVRNPAAQRIWPVAGESGAITGGPSVGVSQAALSLIWMVLCRVPSCRS